MSPSPPGLSSDKRKLSLAGRKAEMAIENYEINPLLLWASVAFFSSTRPQAWAADPGLGPLHHS